MGIWKEQEAFMLPFTLAFRSLRVIRAPGGKDDHLGLVCIHIPAAAMNIDCMAWDEGVNAKLKTPFLCVIYAWLAWLVFVML